MTRRHSKRKPTFTSSAPFNAGVVTLTLLVLGAGVREDAMTMQFWQQAIWSGGIFAAASIGVWLVAFAVQPSAPLRRASPPQRQSLAYLATAAGLLLIVVDFWLVAADVMQHATRPVPVWRPLAGAAVLPILFAAAAIQANLLPSVAAWNARRLGVRDLNLVLLLSIIALLLLPGGADDWRAAFHPQPEPGALIAEFHVGSFDVTQWLAPVLTIGVALFIGQTALHALRRPGAALMVFAAAIFYQAIANFAFAQASGATALDAVAHFLALLAAVALDVVYMIRIDAADDRRTIGFASTVSMIMAAGTALVLLTRTSSHPSNIATAIVGVLAGSAALGLWYGWCGVELGRWMVLIFREGSGASWKMTS